MQKSTNLYVLGVLMIMISAMVSAIVVVAYLISGTRTCAEINRTSATPIIYNNHPPQNNLIFIKLVATSGRKSITSHLVCNLTTGICGNSLNYNKGKGFYWLGLEDISSLELNAHIENANDTRR